MIQNKNKNTKNCVRYEKTLQQVVFFLFLKKNLCYNYTIKSTEVCFQIDLEERLQAVLWGKVILMMRQVSPF